MNAIVCPWCKKDCDTGFKRPVVAKPCGHVGCYDCLRRAVTQRGTKCPCCPAIIKTFTIEGAPSVEKEKEEERQPAEEEEGEMDLDQLRATVKRLTEELEKDKQEDEDGGVIPMELDELRGMECPELDDDWTCVVCTLTFDNKKNMPMVVSSCYPTKRDHHMPNADRGLAPGCGHTLCERCAMELLSKTDPQCYMCRAHVKDFSVNVSLLQKISTFKGGYYMALAIQLNEVVWREQDLLKKLTDLKAEYPQFEAIKRKAEERKEELRRNEQTIESLNRHVRLVENTVAVSTESQKRLDGITKRLTAQLKQTAQVNKHLFDEVIALRLQAMDMGLIPPGMLGLSVQENRFTGRETKVTVHVTSRDRRILMSYGRRSGDLVSSDAATFARINEASTSSSLTVSNVPDTVEQSFVELANGKKLVQVGSWLHRQIWSKSNSPEGTFDAPQPQEGGGEGGDARFYQPVDQGILEGALAVHRRLLLEREEEEARLPEQKESHGLDLLHAQEQDKDKEEEDEDMVAEQRGEEQAEVARVRETLVLVRARNFDGNPAPLNHRLMRPRPIAERFYRGPTPDRTRHREEEEEEEEVNGQDDNMALSPESVFDL